MTNVGCTIIANIVLLIIVLNLLGPTAVAVLGLLMLLGLRITVWTD